MAHLDEPGNRLTLKQRDVRQVTRRKYDLINAMNFSYWIFSTRKEMLRYFRTVRRSLVSDGIFFLDLFGGWEAQEIKEEKRSEEHTSELQSHGHLVCRNLLEKKKNINSQ